MAGTWKKGGIPPALGWCMAHGRRHLPLLLHLVQLLRLHMALLGHLLRDTYDRRAWANGWGVDSAACTLCFLCAFNLNSKPLYTATFLSFFYAIAYLAVECLMYHTILFASLVPFIFIAGTSMVWMLLQWNSHGPRGATSKKQA